MTGEKLSTPVENLMLRFNEVEGEVKGLAMLMSEKMAEIARHRFENNTEALISCIMPVNTFSDRTFELRLKTRELYRDLEGQIKTERKNVTNVDSEAFRNVEALKRLMHKLVGAFGDNMKEDDNIFDLNETLPLLQRTLVKALLTTNGYEVLSMREVGEDKYYVLPSNEMEIREKAENYFGDEYFHSISGAKYSDHLDITTASYEVVEGIDIEKIGLSYDLELDLRRKGVIDEIMAFHVQFGLVQTH